MLVYYDILSDKEVANDAFTVERPFPGIMSIQSKMITIEEKDVDIGANAAQGETEEDESVDKSEAQQKIDVVHSSNLSEVSLTKSDYKTMQIAYFKKLLDTLNKQKWDSLGVDGEEIPADKKLQENLETEKAKALGNFDKKKYEGIVKTIAEFKAHQEAINNFVKEVITNFKEFNFFTAEDAELGECMIIPARYIGEALAPVFYFFSDGIKEKKA